MDRPLPTLPRFVAIAVIGALVALLGGTLYAVRRALLLERRIEARSREQALTGASADLHARLRQRLDKAVTEGSLPTWARARYRYRGSTLVFPKPLPDLTAPPAATLEQEQMLAQAGTTEQVAADATTAHQLYGLAILAAPRTAGAVRGWLGVIRCQLALRDYEAARADCRRLGETFASSLGPAGLPLALVARELEARALLAEGRRKDGRQKALLLLRDVVVNNARFARQSSAMYRNRIAELVRQTDPSSQLRQQLAYWTSPQAGAERALGLLADEGADAPYGAVATPLAELNELVVLVYDRAALARLAARQLPLGLELVGPQSNRVGATVAVLPGWSVIDSNAALPSTPTLPLVTLAALVALALVVAGGLVLLWSRTAMALSLADQRSEFLARFSHELKTPLTSIRLLAEREAMAGGQHGAVVAREAARLEGLLQNVLRYARTAVSRDDSPLITEPCDLDEVVEDALLALAPLLQGRAVRHEASVDPVMVDGEPEGLKRVVYNLVSNAVRHTPAGTAIELRTEVAASLCRLIVRDYGPGVAKEQQEKIFERYTAEEHGRRGEGMGLGLAICRTIVAAHRGTVYVAQPASGPGAAFIVELPRLEEQ